MQVLKSVKESKLHTHETDQPILFLEAHITQNQLALGQLAEAKPAIADQRAQLDSLNDVRTLLLYALCRRWLLASAGCSHSSVESISRILGTSSIGLRFVHVVRVRHSMW